MPGKIYLGGIYVSVSTLPIVTVRSSERTSMRDLKSSIYVEVLFARRENLVNFSALGVYKYANGP